MLKMNMMRKIFRILFVTALVVILNGCCMKFSDLISGRIYRVGDSIVTSNRHIDVEKFMISDEWYNNGEARVDSRPYTPGSGNNLNARNVNLHFKLDYPLDKITFAFGELGGNINISVNSNFRNIDDMISLNGISIDGVLITVNAGKNGNNWSGTVNLKGVIKDFAVGGQELWIDNFCFRK
jgi:hypothetical protein